MATEVDVRQYVMTPADVSNDVIGLLRAAKGDGWRVVTLGHPELDAVVTLYPGSLTGILGRPSMGKSMLCKQIARREIERIQASGDESACVVYVTLEEAPAVVGMALDGWDLPLRSIMSGDYDLDERELAAMYLVKLPLFVIRHPGVVEGRIPPALTPTRLYAAIQSIVEDYPSDPKAPRRRPSLVVLDYIQLLQADNLAMSEGAKTAQVTAAIEGAKRLAMQLDVPVIMAVQAGRQTDQRIDQMPAMSDAQWASAIEQACDVVLGVHRPCRREDLADQMRSGEPVDVTINGRSFRVTDQLMVVGLIKQRAGIGYGRFPAYLDPVKLTMHGQAAMRDSDRDVALTVEQALLGQAKSRVVSGGTEIRFLCPVHEDKRPSACYNREGGVWNCHACGLGGGLTWGDTPLAPLLGIHTEGVIPLPSALAEIRERRQKIQQEREATEARKHEALLAYWRERRLAERLGRHEDVMAALEREGIGRDAATHFSFGYADYHGTPALAIPWTFRGELRALQYRLLAGEVKHGRYRWHRGSRPSLFNVDAVMEPHDDTMLVVEGAKKAACLWSHGATSVCAVPNKNGWKPEFARFFRPFGRVVFMPDPDAISEACEWARTVPGSRVALLPKKPDDLLVASGGDVDLLASYMETAKVIA